MRGRLVGPLVLRLALRYLKGFGDLCLELSRELLEVVVGDLDLGEDLGSGQLIHLVGEVVSGGVSLDGELQLRDDLFVEGDLKGDIADGLRVGEPALNLGDPVSLLWVFFDKLFDLVDCFYDVLDLKKDALPSHHVADLEDDLLLLLQQAVDCVLVLFVLVIDGRLNGLPRLLLPLLLLAEEHLLLDANHGLLIGAVGVELEADLSLNCQLEAGLPDELFEVIPVLLGH